MKAISCKLDDNMEILKKLLPIGKSFDIITRNISINNTDAFMIGINGMHDIGTLQRIINNLQSHTSYNKMSFNEIHTLVNEYISGGQVQVCDDMETLFTHIVCGPIVLFVDGFSQAIVIDLRKYPVRSIDEPENEKVMRGPRDGFVETMLFNTNLIRRRIRCSDLVFSLLQIGIHSKTDVSIAYIESLADKKLVDKIKKHLVEMKISSLTLGSKSLEELLVKKRWWNPMPSIQKTERPDVACSYLMEGSVLLIVDNSPSVLILPPSIFQFIQSPEDYYKNPITGNVFRIFRSICTLLSLFLLPVLILITGYYPDLVKQFSALSEGNVSPIQILLFVITAEFGLDLMQYASAHTLSSLTTPLSIVGGIVISDIAIRLSWFSDEVIFYAAVTLLSTMVIGNSDFSDALRIYRIFLIITTGFLGITGFIIGFILITVSVITTPTFAKCSYFWPLMPFNWKALKTVLFRIPAYKEQPENVWKRI